MPTRGISIAVDSVGIDPLGHDRPESVYAGSEFLFPRGRSGEVIPLPDAPCEAVLVETDVASGCRRGAIECALTYTSHFSGFSAVERHGLMQGLGLNDRLLEGLIDESNLLRLFPDACLANALFPAHLPFLGGSYAKDLLPHVSREEVERTVRFRGSPLALSGRPKRGLAELFTLAEINQNIFIYAARQAGVRLRTWDDVRDGRALTSSLTHELEGEFDLEGMGARPLPARSLDEAADVLARLAAEHSFVFYKYQIADLVSHTGRLDLARAVFQVIERFVAAVLRRIDADETLLLVTSDHGHLEQVSYHHGHPKGKVPTWCFGPSANQLAERLRRPEGVFDAFAGLAMPAAAC